MTTAGHRVIGLKAMTTMKILMYVCIKSYSYSAKSYSANELFVIKVMLIH